MQLYFGPNLQYFFHDGKGKWKYRAPSEFVDLFKRERISAVHHVAFGTGGSFFVSYTKVIGGASALFKLQEDYPKLHSWLHLEGLQHSWSGVNVCLGLDGAFFAASNQGHRWRNIPEGAVDYYQKFTRSDLFLTSRVNAMDLGFNGTYIGVGIDGTWFWDLGSQYPHLTALGLKEHIPNAKWVTISPFAPDQYFIIFQNGSTHYSLPQEWAGDIAQLFQQYASQAVQSQTPSRFWRRSSSNTSTNASNVQSPHQANSSPSTVNEGMQLANNVFDAYNNVTNAGGQGSGSSFDVNQAVSTMQSSLYTINNAANVGGQGVNLGNQIISNGLMVGQVAGQFAGAAAACIVM